MPAPALASVKMSARWKPRIIEKWRRCWFPARMSSRISRPPPLPAYTNQRPAEPIARGFRALPSKSGPGVGCRSRLRHAPLRPLMLWSRVLGTVRGRPAYVLHTYFPPPRTNSPSVDYLARLRDRQPHPISASSAHALDDHEREER